MSALKLVIVPLVGRKEKTLFEPLEPEYKFLKARGLLKGELDRRCWCAPCVPGKGDIGRHGRGLAV